MRSKDLLKQWKYIKILDTNSLIYRPILNGKRYIIKQELLKALTITKRHSLINENLSKIDEFGTWLIQWFRDFSKDIKVL